MLPASKTPVQLIAPKGFATPQGRIEGYLVLPFFGHYVTLIGGSFDAFADPGNEVGAIGVCLEEHSSKADLATIDFAIPDFTAPSVAATAALMVDIVSRAFEEPGRAIYVGCRAGRGRTGTILAALVKMSDLNVDDPVLYTRANYNRSAVETSAQERLVDNLNRGVIRSLMKKELPEPAAPKEIEPKPTTLVQKLFDIFWG